MTEKKRMHLRLLCMILLAMLCFSIPVCAASGDGAASEKDTLDLLAGKTAGVMTGTPQDAIILAKIPDAKIQYFNSITDVMLALQKGKIDFAALPTVSYYSLVQEYPELGYLDESLAEYDVGTIFARTDRSGALRRELNAYIAELEKNGELEKKQDYWLYPHDWAEVDIPETGENGVLTMATASTMKPFSFRLNGKHAGYDIDIIAGFCREYGYGLEIEDVDFAGILSGIVTGKYDLAAGQISWTEERGKSVDFSDFYYTQKIVPLVDPEDFDTPALVTADTGTGGTDGSGSSGSGIGSAIGSSIQRTLIDEGRWETVLQGLMVTLIITRHGHVRSSGAERDRGRIFQTDAGTSCRRDPDDTLLHNIRQNRHFECPGGDHRIRRSVRSIYGSALRGRHRRRGQGAARSGACIRSYPVSDVLRHRAPSGGTHHAAGIFQQPDQPDEGDCSCRLHRRQRSDQGGRHNPKQHLRSDRAAPDHSHDLLYHSLHPAHADEPDPQETYAGTPEKTDIASF